MSTHSIDLAQPRIVSIRVGERRIDHQIPRIEEKLWFEYFDGIISTAERDGSQIVQRVDSSSAGVELVDKLLPAKSGFEIPFSQKLAIASVLTSAYVPDQDMPGFGQVPLVALWSASETGTMRRHKDLVHEFGEPTAEQNRRYRRDDSRAQIIGGSRKGTTVYRGPQRTLAALYDELIVNVSGYTFNGEALQGREMIARCMDTYHKVATVARIFAPAGIEIEDDEE